MARELREVVYVDGVRTAFGKAGPGGLFWKTRADDMAVKAVRELLRRNPEAPPERIGDVVMAATAQVGDQGLTLGRDVALLAGLPHTVPGLRRRPHVRRRAHGGDGRRRRDRDGRLRPRDRGRRRAHGASPDGRGRRLQPALRRRAPDRRERGRDGPDRGEPARRLPAAHEGGRRPLRRRVPAPGIGGVGRARRRLRATPSSR